MNTVLVCGASQGVGFATVKQALRAGYRVKALARSADRMLLDHAHLEKIAASALDAPAVRQAVAGVDAVIQTLGAPLTLGAVTLFSDASRVLVEAMQAERVSRLIVVTGLGAGDSRGKGGLLYDALVLPLLLKRSYDDKDVQEMIVRGSGLAWTIVRPGVLTQGPAGHRYQVLCDPAQWRLGRISRADVADFLVRQIVDRGLIGKTPLLID